MRRRCTLIIVVLIFIQCKNWLWSTCYDSSFKYCRMLVPFFARVFVFSSTFSNWSNKLLKYYFKHTFNLQCLKFVITSFFVWFLLLARALFYCSCIAWMHTKSKSLHTLKLLQALITFVQVSLASNGDFTSISRRWWTTFFLTQKQLVLVVYVRYF